MVSSSHRIPLLSRLAMTRCDATSQAALVTQHLRRLLNTREGEALANPAYGLTDLVDLLAELPHTAEQIGYTIEQCIRRFEPRLIVHAVTLTHDAPRHTLQFAIEASLVDTARARRPGSTLQLSARLDAHGRIEVEA